MFGSRPKKMTPAKIALNRISIPKTSPPKWFPPKAAHSHKPEALKEAADLLRKKKCQYARVVRIRDEDGTWWAVYTYPDLKYPKGHY